MSARTLVYRLMLLSPVFLLFGLGVSARLADDPFQPVETTPLDHKAISAYVGFVRLADDVNRAAGKPEQAQLLTRVASEWAAAEEEGKLKPLLPSEWTDTNMEGVKGDAYFAQTRVVRRLIHRAEQSVKKGRHADAAKDLSLALRVSQTLKYSTFSTVYDCGKLQRNAVTMLTDLLPHLNEGQREPAKAALNRLLEGQEKLKSLDLRMRSLYVRALRQSNPNADIRQAPDSFIHKRGDTVSGSSPTGRRSALLVSNDMSLPTTQSEAQACYESEQELAGQVKEALKTLGETSTETSE